MSSNDWPKAIPLLVLAGLLAYANCVTKTLIFDDDAWIIDTSGIDDEWKYLKSIKGRPLLGLTNIALHKAGRNNPVGHHVLNILIHLAAGLTLYGVVRRSLLRPRFGERFAGRASSLAFAAALLWMLHPLQVQCVTYIIQRGESMAGLFYLLILYAILRADEARDVEAYSWRRFAWYLLAVASVALGYGCKETMASVPAAVILFDRIFLARSWRELIRRRRLYYLFFLATWGAFTIWHLSRAKESEGGIGFGMEAVTPTKYALTQAGVILYYLKISVWPRGLVIDYQTWPWTTTLSEAMPEAGIVGGMLLATAVLLFWRPAIGFVCAWFFITLAPSSSILPIVDAVFEHRMYLALATVMVLGVFLGDGLLRFARLHGPRAWVLAAIAAALGTLTLLRNEEYRSRAVAWERAVERMPNSVRARSNFAHGLLGENRYDEAVPLLIRGLELSEYDPTSLVNLAAAYEQLGNFNGAAECYRRLRDAYSSEGKYWRMHAATLLLLGRWDEADADYSRAGELLPMEAEPRYGRAAALFAMGRAVSAELEAQEATRLDPSWPETVLGMARTTILDERMRNHPDARRSAQTWAELGIKYLESPRLVHRDTLALCYAASGDFERAADECRKALKSENAGPWASVHRDRLRLYELRRVPWPE
jgi:tetratricopeptide (TPR) repeat protein